MNDEYEIKKITTRLFNKNMLYWKYIQDDPNKFDYTLIKEFLKEYPEFINLYDTKITCNAERMIKKFNKWFYEKSINLIK